MNELQLFAMSRVKKPEREREGEKERNKSRKGAEKKGERRDVPQSDRSDPHRFREPTQEAGGPRRIIF